MQFINGPVIFWNCLQGSLNGIHLVDFLDTFNRFLDPHYTILDTFSRFLDTFGRFLDTFGWFLNLTDRLWIDVKTKKIDFFYVKVFEKWLKMALNYADER